MVAAVTEDGGEGQGERWGMINLILDILSLLPAEIKEDAPSKQVDLIMELKAEIRFGSN